jgi:DNA-binding response OmpR family regulator
MTKKILIADDEVHIRILLEKTLEDLAETFDIRFFTASDGDEALSLIRRELPQVVFLDIMMPNRDGYHICEAVNRDPALSGIVIILLTAKGQESDRRLGLQCGARYYITKPFDPNYLLELTRQLLTHE